MKAVSSRLRPYLLFLPLCYSVFIAADDQTVVVTILPDIMHSLKIPSSHIDRASLIVISFLIGYSATMPIMGRISDRWGYRRAFSIALIIFIIGSAAVAISSAIPNQPIELLFVKVDSYNWMIASRVVQSLGAGAVIPISLAAAGHLLDPWHRVAAYGMVGASAEAGAVIGPLWGGAVTQWIGWEWAFWLNIPLAIAALLALTLMPRGVSHNVRVDPVGGMIFALALTTLTLGIFRVADPDPLMFILLATSLILTLVIIARIRFSTRLTMPQRENLARWVKAIAGSEDTGIPKSIFRINDFIWANVTHLTVGAALMIGLVSVPLMAGTVYGLSAIDSGLWLFRMTASIGIAALIGGFITPRIGTRIPTIAGLALSAIGYYMMSNWTLDITDTTVSVHLITIGAGLGLVIAPIVENGLHRIAQENRGVAAAILTLSRNIGMTVGLALIATLGADQFLSIAPDVQNILNDPDASSASGLQVFTNFATYAAAACAIAIVPAWIMSRAYSTRDA